jgi:hypothetical protein
LWRNQQPETLAAREKWFLEEAVALYQKGVFAIGNLKASEIWMQTPPRRGRGPSKHAPHTPESNAAALAAFDEAIKANITKTAAYAAGAECLKNVYKSPSSLGALVDHVEALVRARRKQEKLDRMRDLAWAELASRGENN